MNEFANKALRIDDVNVKIDFSEKCYRLAFVRYVWKRCPYPKRGPKVGKGAPQRLQKRTSTTVSTYIERG